VSLVIPPSLFLPPPGRPKHLVPHFAADQEACFCAQTWNQWRGERPCSGPSTEKPPSTGRSTPVIQEAAPDTANSTAWATSEPEPTRPSGCTCAPTWSACSREPPLMRSTAGDQVQAGETASTRMP